MYQVQIQVIELEIVERLFERRNHITLGMLVVPQL